MELLVIIGIGQVQAFQMVFRLLDERVEATRDDPFDVGSDVTNATLLSHVDIDMEFVPPA